MVCSILSTVIAHRYYLKRVERLLIKKDEDVAAVLLLRKYLEASRTRKSLAGSEFLRNSRQATLLKIQTVCYFLSYILVHFVQPMIYLVSMLL